MVEATVFTERRCYIEQRHFKLRVFLGNKSVFASDEDLIIQNDPPKWILFGVHLNLHTYMHDGNHTHLPSAEHM